MTTSLPDIVDPRESMKRQTRPFTVETKRVRARPAGETAPTFPDRGLDEGRRGPGLRGGWDQAPAFEAFEAPASETRRQAERLFAGALHAPPRAPAQAPARTPSDDPPSIRAADAPEPAPAGAGRSPTLLPSLLPAWAPEPEPAAAETGEAEAAPGREGRAQGRRARTVRAPVLAAPREAPMPAAPESLEAPMAVPAAIPVIAPRFVLTKRAPARRAQDLPPGQRWRARLPSACRRPRKP